MRGMSDTPPYGGIPPTITTNITIAPFRGLCLFVSGMSGFLFDRGPAARGEGGYTY